MRHAREHGYMVFTHDLDFGALLALTQAARELDGEAGRVVRGHVRSREPQDALEL